MYFSDAYLRQKKRLSNPRNGRNLPFAVKITEYFGGFSAVPSRAVESNWSRRLPNPEHGVFVRPLPVH